MDYLYNAADKTVTIRQYGREGMRWYHHLFGGVDPRAAYNKENISEASDQELRDFVNRKNLEDQYMRASSSKGAVQKYLESYTNQIMEKAVRDVANATYDWLKNEIKNAHRSRNNTP